MQPLKALVIGMGVLIVLGLTLLGWGLYKKASDPDFKMFDLSGSSTTEQKPMPSAMPAIPDSPPASGFDTMALDLARECSLSSMTASGYQLYLHIGPELSDCEKIIVIDTRQGKKLGIIDLRP